MNKKALSLAVVGSACALLLTSCAVVPPTSGDNPNDPWETFNRQTHAFNMAMDEYILHPVAVSYAENVPQPVQDGVSNFFGNLGEPGNMINNFLQGKFKDGFVSIGRFLVNTTVGIGGIFDVASHMNMERAPEDFGQTLGKWGVPSGPYVVWPFFGPNSVRDTADIPAAWAMNPLTYVYLNNEDLWPMGVTLGALDVVDTRASLLATDSMLQTAIDPYIAVREAYLQYRENLVWDGNPPLELLVDEFEDDFEDDYQE